MPSKDSKVYPTGVRTGDFFEFMYMSWNDRNTSIRLGFKVGHRYGSILYLYVPNVVYRDNWFIPYRLSPSDVVTPRVDPTTIKFSSLEGLRSVFSSVSDHHSHERQMKKALAKANGIDLDKLFLLSKPKKKINIFGFNAPRWIVDDLPQPG